MCNRYYNNVPTFITDYYLSGNITSSVWADSFYLKILLQAQQIKLTRKIAVNISVMAHWGTLSIRK